MIDSIIECLRAEAEKANRRVQGTAWYVFGSVLINARMSNDIDLVVVCRLENDVVQIRELLRPICLMLPLHLFLVTSEEERQFDFVAAQRCRQIYPIGAA